MSDTPEEEAEHFVLVRDGYIYQVTWAVRGLPLVGFRPVDPISYFISELFLFIEAILAEFIPVKVGILRQKEVSWEVFPKVLYKEWIPGIGDFEFVEQRMEELLVLVKQGHFDHLKPGKS